MQDLSYLHGKGLILNDKCVVKHPSLADIDDCRIDCNEGETNITLEGEEAYLTLVYSLISNRKDVADLLWYESNIWYEDIKDDWTFFIQKNLVKAEKAVIQIENQKKDKSIQGFVVTGITKVALNYFFNTVGNYCFIEKDIKGTDQKQIILYNVGENNILSENNFKFTQYYYDILVDYLKKINWIYINYETDKYSKRNGKIFALKYIYKKRKRKTSNTSYITLTSIASSIIAKQHNYEEVWNLPIYVVYDLFYRYNKIEEYNNTMAALYAGAIDMKKNPVNWEQINWSSIIKLN